MDGCWFCSEGEGDVVISARGRGGVKGRGAWFGGEIEKSGLKTLFVNEMARV